MQQELHNLKETKRAGLWQSGRRNYKRGHHPHDLLSANRGIMEATESCHMGIMAMFVKIRVDKLIRKTARWAVPSSLLRMILILAPILVLVNLHWQKRGNMYKALLQAACLWERLWGGGLRDWIKMSLNMWTDCTKGVIRLGFSLIQHLLMFNFLATLLQPFILCWQEHHEMGDITIGFEGET